MSARIAPSLKPRRVPPSVPILIVIFALSRAFYAWRGVLFNDLQLRLGMQFIDPDLMEDFLLQSIWNLHSQPPLFNFLVGLVVKVVPVSNAAIFQGLFALLGLLQLLAMDSLMRGLSVHRVLRWIVLVLCAFNPSFVLIEHWFFYTHPVACMMTFAAWAFMRYAKSRSVRDAAILFALLFAIVMTRSMFHLVWFVALAAFVVWLARGNRKQVALVAAIPGALIFLWCLKTFIMFGTFGTTTWMGLSLAKNTTFRLSEEERREHVERGELSPLALVVPFSGFTSYRDYLPKERTGIKILDRTHKSTGSMNFNHVAVIEIARDYESDAKWTLIHYPARALESQWDSWINFFQTTQNYFLLDSNRARVPLVERIYRRYIYAEVELGPKTNAHPGTFFSFILPVGRRPISITLIVMFVGIVIWIPVWCWCTRHDPAARVNSLTLLFIWLNILYVSVIGNMMETGENNRFRFNIEPISWIAFAVILDWIRCRVIARLSVAAPHY